MTMQLPAESDRFETLDAVRGFSVLGILLMNIVSMGLPAYAYINPTYWGAEGPIDYAVWAVMYVLADGKMRALFTMLFGASLVLIAERAAARPEGMSPAQVHYRRLFWLFVFGMIHAWGFWYGDILVQYAAAGAIMFPVWRWRARALLILAAAMLLVQLGLNYGHHQSLASLRAAATAPNATPAAQKAWRDQLNREVPPRAMAEREVRLYGQGGVVEAFQARRPMTIFFQTFLLPLSLPEVFAFMAFGMALFRTGFLTGQWSRGSYWLAIGAGYLVAVPLTAFVASTIAASGWDPVLIPLTDAASMVLRPFITLAHAAGVILFVQSGAARWLAMRLAAAGRMAFSNYLGTTLVATTLFYGYGLGLFGTLGRAELYLVVLGIWALILLWSKPWLDRFDYGPLEWLWRRLARGPAGMRQSAIAS
jgi:uncharacterized protein